MVRFRTRALPPMLLALLVTACAGGTPSSDPGAGADDDPIATAEASADGGGGDDAAAGDAGASVEVTVSGGEFEGTYAGSVADGGCSRGATGENTFGLQYSTDEQVELSSLQLVVNDADEAAGGGTDDFMTSVTFGELLSGTTLDINPPEGTGTGSVSVDDRGDSATITIEGETSDGAAIDATVECHSVFDFGS